MIYKWEIQVTSTLCKMTCQDYILYIEWIVIFERNVLLFTVPCGGDSGAPVWRDPGARVFEHGPELVAVVSSTRMPGKWFEPICNPGPTRAYMISRKVLEWIDTVEKLE